MLDDTPLPDSLPENPIDAAFMNSELLRILGNQYHISKDAKSAVQNIAQIFLMMITSVSSDHAGRTKRRHVVQKSDVREALEKMDLGHLTMLGDRDLNKKHKDQSTSQKKSRKLLKQSKPTSNPYCKFIQQEIPKLKLMFPGYKLPDLAREASKKWKNLSCEEKGNFK